MLYYYLRCLLEVVEITIVDAFMVRRVFIFFVLLWPGVCFSGVGKTYDVYTKWEDWARLRTGFQPGLASSYDRGGGNYDFSYYEDPAGLRTGNDPNVTVTTIQGPGVIYRFWMPHYTAKRNFIIRMYFDGQVTP